MKVNALVRILTIDNNMREVHLDDLVTCNKPMNEPTRNES